MKISTETLNILKNMSDINPSLSVTPGNSIRSISTDGSTMVNFITEESWDKHFSVYDLNMFLKVFNILEGEIDLEIRDRVLVISDENITCNYGQCDPKMVNGNGVTDLPDINYETSTEFTLTQEDLFKIDKASRELRLSRLIINSNKDSNIINIKLCTSSQGNTGGEHSFVFNVGKDNTVRDDFEVKLNIKQLKLYPGSYNVKIDKTSKLIISEWTHNTGDLRYYIALKNKGE
jgi:hypothetical protein